MERQLLIAITTIITTTMDIAMATITDTDITEDIITVVETLAILIYSYFDLHFHTA